MRELTIVFYDELKQAFLTKKSIFSLLAFVLLFLAAVQWMQRIQEMFEERFSDSQVKLGKIFMGILSDRFYDSFPFLENLPIFSFLLFSFSIFALPILIIVISYDTLSQEINDKVFRYFTFRLDIKWVVLSKFAAYALQFALISAIIWVVSVLYNKVTDPELDLINAWQYAFHYWFLTQFIMTNVVAFSVMMSAIFKKPLRILMIVTILGGFLFGKIKFLNSYYVEWIKGMYHPLSGPLYISVATMVVLTVIYLTIAMVVLKKKDL